jgi:hypothetical protein
MANYPINNNSNNFGYDPKDPERLRKDIEKGKQKEKNYENAKKTAKETYNRNVESINKDFNTWSEYAKSGTMSTTTADLQDNPRMGVKSYMNDYAFISFGTDYINGDNDVANTFLSGKPIDGVLSTADEWRVPTTKKIIEWSRKISGASRRSVNVSENGAPDENGNNTQQTTVFNNSRQVLEGEARAEQNSNSINSAFGSGGSITGIGNFKYDWKDFTFCKYYGKIPNNRLITLRRFKLPVLDSGVIASKERLAKIVSEDNVKLSGQDKDDWITSDSARALTYFGDGTSNSLDGILGFTVGLNWTDRTTSAGNPDYNNNVSSQGSNFLNEPMDYYQLMKKVADDLGYGRENNFVKMLTASAVNERIKRMSGVTGDGNNPTDVEKRNNALRNQVLDVDPFKDSWVYRIYGPVNVLLKTKSRSRGLKFTDKTISLTFEYDMTQIGTMNPKLAMLDIISNMLSLCYNSGSFWGGDYRFQRDATSLPMPDGLLEQLENSANGGELNADTIINEFMSSMGGAYDSITDFFSKKLGKTEVGQKVVSGYQDKMSDGNNIDQLTKEFNKLDDELRKTPATSPDYKTKSDARDTAYNNLNDAKDKLGDISFSNLFESLKDLGKDPDILRVVISNGLFGQDSDIKSVAKKLMVIKPLITGEPVGEWHLTVGNPMNPIAMIGNLVCNDMTMSYGEELGYDDFPTTLKFTVNLSHGRDRDKGDIEAIFNMGQGRTYLNIKGATPWETGFSTRSSDNDTAGSVGQNQTNVDGTTGKVVDRDEVSKINENVSKAIMSDGERNPDGSLNIDYGTLGFSFGIPTYPTQQKSNVDVAIPWRKP